MVWCVQVSKKMLCVYVMLQSKMPVATHEISLHGVSGAIFWFILASLIFYVLGFATVGWEKFHSTWIGLWATCSSTSYHYGDEGVFCIFLESQK